MTTKSKNAVIKKSDKVVSVKERGNGNASKEVKLPTREEIQAALDKNIQNFREKNELIRNRAKFLKTKEDLQGFIADQGSDYDEFMEDSGKKVAFVDNERYSSSDGISISNNYLVREFAQFMISKVEIKLAEIEKQIMI